VFIANILARDEGKLFHLANSDAVMTKGFPLDPTCPEPPERPGANGSD